MCLLLLQRQQQVSAKPKDAKRAIQILNESGRRVDVFWVNPDSGELVKQTEPFVHNGGTLPLESWLTHTFQVRELPSSKTGNCGDPSNEATIGICRMGTFSVNENDAQIIFIRKGMVIDHTDDKTRARDDASKAITKCHTKAKDSISAQENITPGFLSTTYDELMVCVESSVAVKIQEVQEEVNFQANLRKSMGDLIENYTCVDESLKPAEPLSTEFWRDPGSRNRKKVDKHMSADTTHLHYIHGFVSAEECEAIYNAAQDRFQHNNPVAAAAATATTQQPSCSNTVEDTTLQSLKASFARITTTDIDSSSSNIIEAVRRRVIDYTKHATSLGVLLDENHKQEDLMAIRFSEGDVWQAHCDSKCNGSTHTPGERVATMVIYCNTAQKGSAINFRNAGVTIIPENEAAVFFSYAAPDGETDKGYTEYSTCPVLEGEQKIVTQWVRNPST
jgi:hypothetical protein